MTSSKVVLAFDIFNDIKRHIVTYSLLIVMLFSAFMVIYFTHVNRQTTAQLEVLLSERDNLDVEWRNLLLEQNSLSEHSAIESKAQKLLEMKRPSVDSEIVIKLQ